MLKYILLVSLYTVTAFAAPKLQNSDFATSAQITGAGGTIAQLLNTSKVYDSTNAQLLDTTIAAKVSSSRSISTTAPLAGGGDLSANRTLTCDVASGSQPGCLASADWTTFNNKQPAGSYVTSGTGDATFSGPGAAAVTFATVNGNVGSFTYGSFTVNAKGLITAASSGTAPVTSISVASANGFGGSSSGGATPTLTLTTSCNGVCKGNGTAISTAASGTDYQAPISTSAAVANQFITAFTAPNTFSRAQPAFTDISGAATGAQLPAPALSSVAALDIDWSALKNVDGAYTKTLSANSTFTFSNIVAGQTIVMFITNTASNYTVTWPASAHFPAGTAPVQTVGAKLDVITCKAVSTSVAYCNSVQNFTP